MEVYGLVGKGLTHSFSPRYFAEKFKMLGVSAEYRLFDIDHISELPHIITANHDLRGLNITIPYKREVFDLLDFVQPASLQTGSVNTLKIERRDSGNWISGYNTDVVGFEKSLKTLVGRSKNRKALVLGTGGSSRAVAYVLRKLGFFYLYISRTPQKASQMGYSCITKKILSDYKLIINTTPLGMYPDVLSYPKFPYHLLTSEHMLFDLVYNPVESRFLAFGKERGAKTLSGLKMLEIQADASWEIWRK